MTLICGIDPGVRPTLALLNGNSVAVFEETSIRVKRGKTVKNEAEPRLIARILREWQPDLVIIEKVNPRPGEGVSSSGQFMRARGVLEGVCAGIGIPYELVDPSTWTRQMRLKKGDDAGRIRALELLPGITDLLTRRKDHNRADAILLALWGRQYVVPGHPLFS